MITLVTEASCAVLTAVFPLVLITIVLEQRAVHIRLRKRQWFRNLGLTLVSSSLLGLIVSLLGVQLHGLEGVLAVLLWILAGASIVGLGFMMLAVLATIESQEDSHGV